MEIDLKNYENTMLPAADAYSKAAELLELDLDPSNPDFRDRINDYIDRNYEWYKDDTEYRYMGWDCGDCYMGGDIKKGMVRGDYLLIYAQCPNYKTVSIYKKKS